MTTEYLALSGVKANGTVVQYRAVKMDTTDRQVIAISNANAPDIPIGVLQNDPASGEAADVAIFGVCKMEYGGTITRGDNIAVNNSGQAISDATTEAEAGNAVDLYHIGIALESGSASDVRQVVLLGPRLQGKE